MSMSTASIFALILQCGTTTSASLIAILTPTIGVGCRSLGYLLYGGTFIITIFLTMISTILARISETRDGRSTVVKKFTAFAAIALRRISLFLAFVNATEMVLLTYLQFSNFLANCYCMASVIRRGTDSHITVIYEGWISTMRNSRIAATVLATTCMTIYITFVWIISALPADIDLL